MSQGDLLGKSSRFRDVPWLPYTPIMGGKDRAMACPKNGRMTDVGLVVLRIVLGLTFVFVHGGPKLMGGPERWAGLGGAGMGVFGITSGLAFWGFLAALFETLGGLALLMGVLRIPGSLMILVVMIPATLLHFKAGEYAKAAYPLEIAAAAICLLFTGHGRYALSAMCRRTDEDGKVGGEKMAEVQASADDVE